MKYELLHDLIGQTVGSLSRVAFDERDYFDKSIDMSVLTDTLVFTLTDGRRFELLVSHTDVLFEEIGPGANRSTPPWSEVDDTGAPDDVKEDGTKEVWTSDGKIKFLVFASYELSVDQQHKAVSLGFDWEGLDSPWTVATITEMWAGEDNKRFFAASVLWDRDEKPLLALYRRTDELDVVSLDDLHRRLDHMAYYTESILYHRYD